MLFSVIISLYFTLHNNLLKICVSFHRGMHSYTLHRQSFLFTHSQRQHSRVLSFASIPQKEKLNLFFVTGTDADLPIDNRAQKFHSSALSFSRGHCSLNIPNDVWCFLK